MIFKHWFNDKIYADSQHPYSTKDEPIEITALKYLASTPKNYHKPHRRGVGLSSRHPVYRAEGATGDKQIGERSPGGESIAVNEIGDYGIVEYGFGKYIRVVEKEGQYGKFISLEAGITVAGKNEKGEIITDTKTERWFSVPHDPSILSQIASMLEAASVALNKIGSEAKAAEA